MKKDFTYLNYQELQKPKVRETHDNVDENEDYKEKIEDNYHEIKAISLLEMRRENSDWIEDRREVVNSHKEIIIEVYSPDNFNNINSNDYFIMNNDNLCKWGKEWN